MKRDIKLCNDDDDDDDDNAFVSMRKILYPLMRTTVQANNKTTVEKSRLQNDK